MDNQFKGYRFDEAYQLQNVSAPVLNYSKLKNILVSKNIDVEFESLLSTNNTMFLDQTEKVPHVVFVSFPRCGNTFTRKLFENITGVATGSGQKSNLCPTMALTILSFKGESI